MIKDDKLYRDQVFSDKSMILLLFSADELIKKISLNPNGDDICSLYKIIEILSYLTFVKKYPILNDFRYFIWHFESSYIHNDIDRLIENISYWKFTEDYWRTKAIDLLVDWVT